MTEKIRLEIDDATTPGINSVDANLGKLEVAAKDAQLSLNKAADAAEKIGDADDSVIDVVESLKDVQYALSGVKDDSGEVSKAITKIGDAEAELRKLRDQFKSLGEELREARASAGQLETAIADVDKASPGLNRVEGDLDDIADEANKAERQLKQTADAAKKLGDTGGRDTKRVGLQVTELNQGLEILKKGVELASRAVSALADDGSPAFARLRDSVQGIQQELTKLADDPGIQEWIDDLRMALDSTKGSSNGLGESIRKWQADWATGFNIILEKVGLVQSGTANASIAMAKQGEQRRKDAKETIAADRERILVDEKIAEITARITNELELKNIAQNNSAKTLKAIAEDEEEAMREQERAGTATAKSREASLKKIELIQRRLGDIAKQEADAEIKEQERVAQVKADLQKEWADAVKASAQANAEIEAERLTKLRDEAKAEMEKLMAAIAQAKGASGKSLIDETREAITPQQTRAQLARQARDAARQKWISENRGKVDLQGKASGNTTAERRANQRRADRAIALAQKKAGTKAFRDFNDFTSGKRQAIDAKKAREAQGRQKRSKGKNTFDNIQRDQSNVDTGMTQADITGAQDNLMNSALQAAQTRGDVDAGYVQAFGQLTNANQQQAVINQTTAAEMQRMNQVLSAVIGTNRNTFANGRRMANTR